MKIFFKISQVMTEREFSVSLEMSGIHALRIGVEDHSTSQERE